MKEEVTPDIMKYPGKILEAALKILGNLTKIIYSLNKNYPLYLNRY
jgi:hypothetical protein